MRVGLTFRLYMMRYGLALLASSCTSQGRPTFSEDISSQVSAFLTEKQKLSEDRLEEFRAYLFNKPGSPRYTPLRKALQEGRSVVIERQDYLLADSRLPSSVGALTQDYFDDALSLAHTLKLVKKDQNILLARGRLSLSGSWRAEEPFHLGNQESIFLGLWLLDIDCDWIWAFLAQIPAKRDFVISHENRVDLLLNSWKCILSARQIGSNRPQNARARSRLIELVRITERNVSTKLNLGQPWSWFLIPRLELLVDAGVLKKRERHGLTGYSLTAGGRRLRSLCDVSGDGDVLIRNYFRCLDSKNRPVAREIPWEEIEDKLERVAPEIRTSVGYLPIYETAAALCVSQFLAPSRGGEFIWEIDALKEQLWKESRLPSPRVRLAIDRQGQIYAFRLAKQK